MTYFWLCMLELQVFPPLQNFQQSMESSYVGNKWKNQKKTFFWGSVHVLFLDTSNIVMMATHCFTMQLFYKVTFYRWRHIMNIIFFVSPPFYRFWLVEEKKLLNYNIIEIATRLHIHHQFLQNAFYFILLTGVTC